MPYDAGKPPFKFAEIPFTDGISEPLFNTGLIFPQIRGAWGLTRSVLWSFPSNANGSMIWATNIPAFLGNCIKVCIGRWGQYLAHPWLITPVGMFVWLASWEYYFIKNNAICPLLWV